MPQLLNALAALILSSQLHGTAPETTATRTVTVHTNGTVGLLAFDKREFRRTGVHGKHAAVAFSGFGDVVGVILNKRGTAVCELTGYYDGNCVFLEGCGGTGSAC